MKSKPFTSIAASTLAALLLVGCQTKHAYVKPEGPHGIDNPGEATLTDFKLAAAEVIQMIESDDQFPPLYEKVKRQKGGGQPVFVMVGNIQIGGGKDIKTNGGRVIPYLNYFRAELRTRLRKSGLFRTVDDASSAESISDTLADALVKNADAGLKDDRLLEVFRKHTNADYYLIGVYREFEAAGRYDYVMEMRLVNLYTGETDWDHNVDIGKE